MKRPGLKKVGRETVIAWEKSVIASSPLPLSPAAPRNDEVLWQ